MQGGIYLIIAIIAEVVATSALKASHGLERPWFAIAATAGYLVAFSALAMALKTIPLGIAYAIWCGVGIALLALIGWVVYKERLDMISIIGLTLIMAGVIVLAFRPESTTPLS